MADLKLNGSHDIDWDDIRLTYDNAESVAQRIKILLLRYQGEYVFDTSLGVPYFQELLVKGTAKDYIDTVLIDEISNTVGVLNIDSYESTVSLAGLYQAVFVATTTEGETFQFNIAPIQL